MPAQCHAVVFKLKPAQCHASCLCWKCFPQLASKVVSSRNLFQGCFFFAQCSAGKCGAAGFPRPLQLLSFTRSLQSEKTAIWTKNRKFKFLKRGVLRDEFLHVWELSGWQSEHFLILSYGPKLIFWLFLGGRVFFSSSSCSCSCLFFFEIII